MEKPKWYQRLKLFGREEPSEPDHEVFREWREDYTARAQHDRSVDFADRDFVPHLTSNRTRPTPEQIGVVMAEIAEVTGRRYVQGPDEEHADRYFPDGGGRVGGREIAAYPPNAEAIPFAAVDGQSKYELLSYYVEWEGFSLDQDAAVMKNVVEGKPPERWMEGVTGILAEEVRQDEQAARVRDYRPEDAASHPERAAEGVRMSERDGEPAREIYQIWHDQRAASERVAEWADARRSSFPVGYRHVADVEAGNIQEAYGLIQYREAMGPDGFVVSDDWTRNPAVSCLVEKYRNTQCMDVIVSPDGLAHRVGPVGEFEVIGRRPPMSEQPVSIPTEYERQPLPPTPGDSSSFDCPRRKGR